MVNMRAAKPDDQSSICATHGRRKNQMPQVVLSPRHTVHGTDILIYTQTQA